MRSVQWLILVSALTGLLAVSCAADGDGTGALLGGDTDSEGNSGNHGTDGTGGTDATDTHSSDTSWTTDTSSDSHGVIDTEQTFDTEVDTDESQYEDKKFRGVKVVDRDYLQVQFKDGDVVFLDDASGSTAYGGHSHEARENSVVRYGTPLNTVGAVNTSNWRLRSSDDAAYGGAGQSPLSCHRKSKLNGMAEMAWSGSDYQYEHTMEHFIYLRLPSSLQQGKTYTLEIDFSTNTDVTSVTFTYDHFKSRSEAVHVNLVGYHPQSPVKAADLYIWMGDGGARDYASFVGNRVYLYNVETQASTEVGTVNFWKNSAGEAQGYNFTQSNVWNADFSSFTTPGAYRLAIEGVGASQDFVISTSAYLEPFRVSTLGFFYMRIGQDSMDMTPVPRRPLWIPGVSPVSTRVIVTDMHPYHPAWAGGGDRWDQPAFFANYVKSGSPENPDAFGGHSDALDWDRHLGHVSIIHDMLLPYILTDGAIGRDDLGIAESGNGIPDIIDEARNEVDFWLRLRHNGGYSHGLSNPNKDNILYQADNTAMAAWANAANAAMLAEALTIAGDAILATHYKDAAVSAYNYASGLAEQMLDRLQDVGEARFRGRDFKMMAAAYLYNLTGQRSYEDVVAAESLVTSPTSPFESRLEYNQLYAMSAYLRTRQTVNYPTLHGNMRAAMIHHARAREANYMNSRPSRRTTDNEMGYFHTIQNVHRSIVAHAVSTSAADRELFERALVLEADWGLGRNPLNMIQMTTAATKLASKRSVENCYTSGRNDGTPGLHPGHTPYLNIDDWACGMVMGCPSWMYSKSHPGNVSSWPRGELYFNTRFVWAHSEFTPQQTMRGKMALYGYLYGLSR